MIDASQISRNAQRELEACGVSSGEARAIANQIHRKIDTFISTSRLPGADTVNLQEQVDHAVAIAVHNAKRKAGVT